MVFNPVSDSAAFRGPWRARPWEFPLSWLMDDLCHRGFTCERSPGKEEGGSSWPAGAESGCKVVGASPGGTSRSHRCTEVEDLSSRTRHKWRSVSSDGRSKAFLSSIITNFTCQIVNEAHLSSEKPAPISTTGFDSTAAPSSGRAEELQRGTCTVDQKIWQQKVLLLTTMHQSNREELALFTETSKRQRWKRRWMELVGPDSEPKGCLS